MPIIPAEYVNSLCEIKTLDNKELTSGTITSITDDSIDVDYRDNIYLLSPNTLVKLQIVNHKLGFRVLVGKVYIGTNKFIRLVEVMTLMDYEKRDFFRIAIEETTIYSHTPFDPTNETDLETTHEVQIKNVSLCGVYFLSDEILNLEAKIYLLINLSKGPTVFPCVVKRIQREEFYNDENVAFDFKYGYGCELVDIKTSVSDDLYKFIFDKQLALLKSRQQQ